MHCLNLPTLARFKIEVMNEKLQLLKKWTETSSMKRPSVEIIDSIEVALRDLGPSTKREPVKRKVIEELQRLQASGRTDAEKREIISYMYWMFPTLPEKWLAHVFSWGSICKVWEWINPLSSVVVVSHARERLKSKSVLALTCMTLLDADGQVATVKIRNVRLS